MSLLDRLRSPPPPPLSVLWQRIVEVARDPAWYLRYGVPDTLDGRFDMVALVASLVMLRLDREGAKDDTVFLTERFVDDMEGSLREIGVGDMVVGKHLGNMVGAFGGRLGAYRAALADPDPAGALERAIRRNLFRGDEAGDARGLAEAARALRLRIDRASPADLRAGRW
ncbi:ubiquinol-cytochrome C chaperone family protein [Thermaurantiacus sp.]